MTTSVPPFDQWPPTAQPPAPARRVLPFDGLPQPNIAYCPGWRLQSFYFGNLLTMQSVASGGPAGAFGASELQQLDWRALAAFALANHPADDWGVTILNDQSGHGRDLVPIDPTRPPKIWLASDPVAPVTNGLTPAPLPAGNSSINAGLIRNDSSGIVGDPALTIALAYDNFDPSSLDGQDRFTVGSAGLPELWWIVDVTTPDLFILDANTDNGVGWDLTVIPGFDAFAFHRYIVTKEAGSGYGASGWTLYVDRQNIGAPTTVIPQPVLNIGNGQTTLYAANNGDVTSSGRIALAAVWTRVLSSAQRAQVEAFLDVI